LHAAIVVTPTVKGTLGNTVCPAYFANGAVAYFGFAQDADNLLFGKSLLHLQISSDLVF
jgi:hypothetical protein